MHKIKISVAPVKKFVSDHRVGIAVAATATLFIAIMYSNAVDLAEFLEEHDLFDEYMAS